MVRRLLAATPILRAFLGVRHGNDVGDEGNSSRGAAPSVPALVRNDFGLSLGEELYDVRRHAAF
jgi:hypothetical protein